MTAICAALVSRPTASSPDKPRCVVAHTNKGHGISFMADNVAWHHKVPNAEQYAQAMRELEEAAP
jgi:transketolase